MDGINEIDWSGKISSQENTDEAPSDTDFCRHYEHLLNPALEDTDIFEPNIPTYIPVLDDPISPNEVDEAIKSLKKNKAAGVDGLAPGILKLLTTEWILLLTWLFNLIF